MLERIPLLQQFSRLYWNQMGDECYGTIGKAFRQFLEDSGRLPDQGKGVRRSLYGELMLVLDNPDYAHWLQSGRYDIETINAVGGRFIFPDEIGALMAILDEDFEADA